MQPYTASARISQADIRRERFEQNKRNREFYDCIRDIVLHPVVLRMKAYAQHCDTDCYEHCLNVAYQNFLICKRLGLDARSAARGGMLHDLFLYDWRTHSRKTGDRLHAITHPAAAYRNARKYFHLNPVEREVIAKHMWPLSIFPPRYPETYVICLTDKYCGSMEILDHYSRVWKKWKPAAPLAWAMERAVKKYPRIRRLQEILPELDSMESAAVSGSFSRKRPQRSAGWSQGSGRSRGLGQGRAKA